jgi:hypothetical protein
MAEKLIPGIPHATRIAILQQTDDQDKSGSTYGLKLEKSVLESVLGSDEARNEAARLADFLSKSFETDDPLKPVQAIRKIRHEQAEKKLFLAHKNAHLKSGARGLQARKGLKAAESKLESTQEL